MAASMPFFLISSKIAASSGSASKDFTCETRTAGKTPGAEDVLSLVLDGGVTVGQLGAVVLCDGLQRLRDRVQAQSLRQ